MNIKRAKQEIKNTILGLSAEECRWYLSDSIDPAASGAAHGTAWCG